MSDRPLPHFVVVDNDRSTLDNLVLLCTEAEVKVTACEDVTSAQVAIARRLADSSLVGVVTDLKMPGTDGQVWGGWQVLRYAYSQSARLALAAITGYSGDNVVSLFRSGAAVPAFTIFDKPTDWDELGRWLVQQRERWLTRLAFVLQDAPTARIYHDLAPIYSRSTIPILILGETGTGKEGLARHIHRESLRTGPFVAVNCGALEPSVAFGEFFGHQQGSFTDAHANDLGFVLRASGYQEPTTQKAKESFVDWLRRGTSDLRVARDVGVLSLFGSEAARRNAGTLFLDEVGALPPKLMAGLLRMLSSHDVIPLGHRGSGFEAYCRIIAATNESYVLSAISLGRTEEGGSRGGDFRGDLFYRLGGAVLELPPLRDRERGEIGQFLESPYVWRELGLSPLLVDPLAVESVEALFHDRTDPVARQYQNGNFRSLRNLLHRAAMIALAEGSGTIAVENMTLAVEHGSLSVARAASAADIEDLGEDGEIREKFRQLAATRRVRLSQEFSSDELREVARDSSILVAAVFLDALLMRRLRPNPHKAHYDQGELEVAVTRGLSANAFLNKTLRKEHFRHAAVKFFGLDEDALSEEATISEVVAKVRTRATRGVVGKE